MAIEQGAKHLLEATAHIKGQLDHTKKLRRQKSKALSYDEKDMLDRVIGATEKAVDSASNVLEPARVDMKTYDGQLRLSTRLQFVIPDVAQISACQSKLTNAGSDINTALAMLCNKEGSQETSRSRTPSLLVSTATPEYRESEWLHASKQMNNRKRRGGIAPNASLTSSSSDLRSSFGSPAELEDISRPVPVQLFEFLDKDIYDGLEVDDRSEKLEAPIVLEQTEKMLKVLTGTARSRSWLEHYSNAR